MEIHTKYYKVAGITVRINSDFPITDKTFDQKFKLFETMGPGNDNIIINHHFYWPDNLGTILKNEIYKKNQWQIFKTKDAWIYKYHPLISGEPEYRAIGVFNENHTCLDVYTDQITQTKYQDNRFKSLTLFNNDQILFAKLLCARQGLIIHSNGFDINGNGILLTGVSGSGKSTLSQMLKERGFQILCDDRMFVRKMKDNYFIHGNWCHGAVQELSTGMAPLKAIFFLEQSDENHIAALNDKSELIQRIMQAMVKPFLDSNEWHTAFLIIEDLIKNVSWYKLRFDLSGKICNQIIELL